MSASNNNASQQQQNRNAQQNSFQVLDFLLLCLSRWYWFVLAIGICLFIAAATIIKSPSVYNASASVMIKLEGSSKKTDDIAALLSTRGASMGSKLPNEIATFRSPALMTEVVKRMKLDVNYAVKGRVRTIPIYGESCPCVVTFLDKSPSGVSFCVTPTAYGYDISQIKYNAGNETIESEETVSGAFSDTLSTTFGHIIIEPSDIYTGTAWTNPVYVSRISEYAAVKSCSARLSVAADDMKNFSDILNLNFLDNTPQKAEDVLKTLIDIYNEMWITENNTIAVSTAAFITERLKMIEAELSDVDGNISDFKSKNLLPDVKAASSIYMSESQEINRQMQELDNQIYMAQYVREYVNDPAKANDVIPMGSIMTDATISAQIKEYNTSLLQKNTLLANSSTDNPIVKNLDQQLKVMRSGISSSITSLVEALRTKQKNLQQSEEKTTRNIAANPNQEKYLLTIQRQQKVKETLYIFLLQKREENELSQAFEATNTRIIAPPAADLIPVAPQKGKILLIAILIGLCIPAGYLYVSNVLLDRKVRGRKDFKNYTFPFAGEIPMYEQNRRKWYQTSKTWRAKNDAGYTIVVKHGERNVVNEAFRVVRTNLEFICTAGEDKVIAVTSFNPGSGKTFITANLAASLALKDKKVVIVEGDLRHASLSRYAADTKKGIAAYLAGTIDNVEDIIHKAKDCTALDIIPVGAIPPNPSELLGTDRFKALIAALREKYNYVFIDCPPVDVVADTKIINSAVADRTLFITRSGMLDKDQVADLQKMYDEQELKNIAVILNGTEMATSSGYRYGYGYGYGYKRGYGYNYGYKYGYGSSEEEKEAKKS